MNKIERISSICLMFSSAINSGIWIGDLESVKSVPIALLAIIVSLILSIGCGYELYKDIEEKTTDKVLKDIEAACFSIEENER